MESGYRCKRMLRRKIISFCCCMLVSLPSLAWDNFGHRLAAKLAYSRLEPAVRTNVDALLGGGEEAFVDASIWADRIKSQRPETRPWHYVNIPLDAEAFDEKRDCPKRDCIVARLEDFISVLSSDASADQKREALRFVIHLVADIHQPLHCANNSDRGGKDVALVWDKRKTNLHEVWNHYVLTNTLNEVMDTKALGAVVDWCNESHAIARQIAYEGLPEPGEPVSEDYMSKARIAATDQLAKAAARLAFILNCTRSYSTKQTGE